jgi:hypothetical protein
LCVRSLGAATFFQDFFFIGLNNNNECDATQSLLDLHVWIGFRASLAQKYVIINPSKNIQSLPKFSSLLNPGTDLVIAGSCTHVHIYKISYEYALYVDRVCRCHTYIHTYATIYGLHLNATTNLTSHVVSRFVIGY